MLSDEIDDAPAAVALLDVRKGERRHFRTPQPAAEKNREDGAIALALDRIFGRRIEQLSGLRVAERRRAAFIAIRHRPLNAVHRITGDRVPLAEVIEQRGQSRELAPDAGGHSPRVSRSLRQAMTCASVTVRSSAGPRQNLTAGPRRDVQTRFCSATRLQAPEPKDRLPIRRSPRPPRSARS